MTHTTKARKIYAYRFIRAIIIATLALCAIIGLGRYIIGSGGTNTTRMAMHAYAPDATDFADDNIINFVTADGIPDVNNNREMNPADKLAITYEWLSGPYAPALAENISPTELNAGIKITPHIKGTWSRIGASRLVFMPDADWPAGQKFNVKISRKLFSDGVHIDRYSTSFYTAPLVATINSFNIYPVPNTPRTVVAVAIVSFNYPVNSDDFDRLVTMRLDRKKIDYNVRFDRYHRTAFITTAPITVDARTHTVRMRIGGVAALYGNDKTQTITADTTIESEDNLFKTIGISTVAADDARGNAQQLILINMTAGAAKNTKWPRYVDAYLLPQMTDADTDEKSHAWADDEITPQVLRKSQKLTLTPVEFANPTGVYQYALSYDVSDQNDRYIYVSVRDGIESAGGFVMKNTVSRVLRVPYPEKIVKIAGAGALVSLAGDKKLGIMARGGADAAYINLYKIKSHEINHLVSQTYNIFAGDIDFKSWSFGVYDMSVVFQKKLAFADPSMKKTNYASLDLGDYLSRGGTDKTGIFIIQAAPTQTDAEYSDMRLILLTDLGIIRKKNLDETSTLFVSHLASGMPAADVEISVLGRNGGAIWAGRTDTDGRADVPRFAWNEYRNEKEPVAIVARDGDDVSFIPYRPGDTQVEYSKFDIDGVYTVNTVPMNAFVFTDRGIYRPGEGTVIAGVIKNKAFNSLAGVPVKLDITDPRGRNVFEEIFSLTADGMFDIQYTVSDAAAIGDYNVRIYSLNNHNKPRDLIGNTSFRVEEFVPDNLKITASVADATDTGWISPNNLTADISLRNLFGTPAVNRRVSAHATLRPIEFTFPKYRDYTFTQNYIAGTGLAFDTARRAQTYSTDLPVVRTDDNGHAVIPVHFEHTISSGTYLLTLNVHGFDGGDGKSVQTTVTARTSDAKYLVGWHANSDLKYVSRGATRRVRFVAVDPTGGDVAATDLKMTLIRRENLVSLVKDYNDYYKYQSVTRDQVVSQSDFAISADGTEITLNTDAGGTYFVQITDASDKILANIEYFVAADENNALAADTRAELQIKLNATEFAPGSNIELGITAPYAGTGLITIERDRVYAYKWFRTQTTSSVQHITLPRDFEGTGYVNVSFVRDINSRDIFTSPYAYAVAPFSADIGSRRIGVSLNAPDIIRDNRLTVEYKTDRAARMMIFGIDAGILQVARYNLPNPITHFFQKAALQVETFQILSLLMPEYNILREFAKTGGGDYNATDGELSVPLTNPFARKTNRPVAFYSGILDVAANTPGNITFDIPEYFNGAIRIFAVATNTTGVGAADTETRVQSPIVISTSAPMAVAPGDTFAVNAVISNLAVDSGPDARAVLTSSTGGNLIQTDARAVDINIPENAERLWTVGLRAGDAPGATHVNIAATILNPAGNPLARRAMTANLSVRPVTTFHTNIHSGFMKSKSTTLRKFGVDMYPEFSVRKLYLSHGAGALMRPMVEYLAHYDFPCTEQLISRTMPYALAPADEMLGTRYDTSTEKINATISTLKNRQNDDGSFDLWGARNTGRENQSNAHTAYLTAYVTQFLNLARDAGFNVPAPMISRAVDYLRGFAATRIGDEFDAYAHAFAIYVITSNGYVTTGYIDTFEEYANQNIKNWQSGLMGAYIATAYKILKQNAKATEMIARYKLSTSSHFEYTNEFLSNVANDSAYAYLRGRYFDASPSAPGTAILDYINGGDYSSYTSAMVLLGLSRGVTTALQPGDATVTVDGRALAMDVTGGALVADIPANANTIEIKCAKCNRNGGLFHTILQQGFPRNVDARSNGIEVSREYYDADGEKITSARVGDMITVKIFARSRTAATISNVVITDLTPGGIVADTIADADVDFSEIREDRILAYADITRAGLVITYTAQVVAAGTFQIPPIYAESMYNPAIFGTGATGKTLIIENAMAE